MTHILRPLAVLCLSLTARADDWALDRIPAVPPPAAPNSKAPAPPKDFAEVKMDFAITPGPFEPTWESIEKNHPGSPEWLRESKFGVFIHWGPQAFGRSGDWYARNLYKEGEGAYANHLKNFGHPSEFGYKDVLNAWTAPKWDPDRLTGAFHDAGIRFMMAVGVHHDNFDLWDSKYEPWNSVNIGPKKDMMGGWKREAAKRGMHFGITFHHEYNWWWFQTAFGSDTKGPKAGVPYDGRVTLADGKGTWWERFDPRYLYGIDIREYHDVANIPFTREGIFQDHQEYAHWYATWWAKRIQDAIEKYDPDLIYTDGNGTGPFCGHHSGSGYKCDAGPRLVAHYYNESLRRRGKVDTLACIKWVRGNKAIGVTQELGVPDRIVSDGPWIGENPIGDWYYGPNYCYEPVSLIRSLLEYASRDGAYACAIPITPEGDLEPACFDMLKAIGAWMKINSEGIYGSRAWKTWGEGTLVQRGKLDHNTPKLPFTPQDIRYTLGKNGALYAWCMAVPAPGTKVTLASCGTGKLLDRPVTSVTLLGSPEKLVWEQTPAGLVITCPAQITQQLAAGFRIE